ncbi:carbohydrate ABC transporter permease [Phytoactinopolyspora limicola]|uniref:carbohydrate ABC transporter permease n=1 Tax=Phytoactinopolyspora limicola TaxID=2715536 RepID=UPI001A9CA009|nr:carbohydrate ABC transporter permease [Phytoactinopolyspora limicola]
MATATRSATKARSADDPAAMARDRGRREGRRPRLPAALAYAVLVIFAVIEMYPIFLMLANSLRSDLDILSNPLGLPTRPQWGNYAEIWERSNFPAYFMNSIYVTGVGLLVLLLISSMAAYYLARFDFGWNKPLLMVFLLGLTLPLKLAVVPLFMLMQSLDLLDTRNGLLLVLVAERLSFAIFVLYGFFITLPREVEEAAMVDGANAWQVYWRVAMPMMRPALATVAIVSIVSMWNEFFFPLVFIRSDELRTIPLGMLTIVGEFSTEWALLFAGLTLSSVPMIIAFVILARQFMEGLTEGIR